MILTVDLRGTVELFAGLVMETTGDAGPLTTPATVMVIDADVAEFPALSVVTAYRVCVPAAAVLVSQEML